MALIVPLNRLGDPVDPDQLVVTDRPLGGDTREQKIALGGLLPRVIHYQVYNVYEDKELSLSEQEGLRVALVNRASCVHGWYSLAPSVNT